MTMKEARVYIPPESEDYTGYTTYVLTGTSTSGVGSFPWPKEELVQERDQRSEHELDREIMFPESREERFLDNDLLEFYKKKGYEV